MSYSDVTPNQPIVIDNVRAFFTELNFNWFITRDPALSSAALPEMNIQNFTFQASKGAR